jgi:hypothetical protein
MDGVLDGSRLVGTVLRVNDGKTLGTVDGITLGTTHGVRDGSRLGIMLGVNDCTAVGSSDGTVDGITLGTSNTNRNSIHGRNNNDSYTSKLSLQELEQLTLLSTSTSAATIHYYSYLFSIQSRLGNSKY